jgi:transposase
LAAPVATFGWLVLATTIEASICSDAGMVRVYRNQTTTVEQGLRWIKNPAAIHPVWLEKRERIAVLSILTVVGLLVYGLIQRQVRQYLQEHAETIPGNKGQTDIPTATVVFESFATLNRVELNLDGERIEQFSGWQAHHERVFLALRLSPLIDDDSTIEKNDLAMPKGP